MLNDKLAFCCLQMWIRKDATVEEVEDILREWLAIGLKLNITLMRELIPFFRSDLGVLRKVSTKAKESKGRKIDKGTTM